MSIDRALFNGLSGLNSFSTAISVVSDNISNANTTGFKSSSVLFGDLVSNEIALSSDQKQNQGSGSSILGMATNFGEGTLEQTSSWSDLAVSGEGFFMVSPVSTSSSSATQTYYTRDGSFHLDGDGNLVNLDGDQVQGYAYNWQSASIATNPTISASSPYTVSGGTINLPQDAGNIKITATDGTNTYTETLGQKAGPSYTFSADDWSFLNSKGLTTAPTISISVNAAPTTATSTTQAIQIPTTTSGSTWPSSYVKYYVTTDGTVHGVGNDGNDYSLYKVALTKFSNADGLERTGNNLYTTGPELGASYNNLSNPEMFGLVQDNTLEGSNVDVAKQMVDLIRYQSSYNANSKTITTANQMLNTSINMVQ